jgi:hypothetical protein
MLCTVYNDTSGIVRLIEAQKNLNEIRIFCSYSFQNDNDNQSRIEKSLIKNAASIQNLELGWKPIIKEFFSYFVNLKSLKMNADENENPYWCQVSLPALETLKTRSVSPKFLTRLIIENTSGQLTTLSIFYEIIFYAHFDTIKLIQAIYKNCLNLRFLKIPIESCDIPEFEKLLINCQYLDGLYILDARQFSYDELFNILTKSSPISLFKFKFIFNEKYGDRFKSLKLFLDNWKNRYPMLLQIILVNYLYQQQEEQKITDLVEEYKVKGIVKKFDINLCSIDEFKWIQEKSEKSYF